MKRCSGCGRTDDKPLGLNSDGKPYLACCPDNSYYEITAMQELQRRLFDVGTKQRPITVDEMNSFIEKEKQQIIDAYGQPRVYYDDNFKQMDEINGEQYYNKTYKYN